MSEDTTSILTVNVFGVSPLKQYKVSGRLFCLCQSLLFSSYEVQSNLNFQTPLEYFSKKRGLQMVNISIHKLNSFATQRLPGF